MNPVKCVFMKQESKKRHEHERTVISVQYIKTVVVVLTIFLLHSVTQKIVVDRPL